MLLGYPYTFKIKSIRNSTINKWLNRILGAISDEGKKNTRE